MGYVRFFLSIAALAVLSACAGSNRLQSSGLGSSGLGSKDPDFKDIGSKGLKPGLDHNSSTVASHTAAIVLSKETLLATARPVAKTTSAFPGDKLIALTFDDGPRPYVLFGRKAEPSCSGIGRYP